MSGEACRRGSVVDDRIDEQLWAGFPLDRTPRPVILLDHLVQLGERGFGSDGEAKLAWLAGAFQARVDLPAGLLKRLAPTRRRYGGRPIEILAVEHVDAPFRTDRGPRELPAYLVTTTGLVEPCIVLDPTFRWWWPPAGTRDALRHAGGDARVSDDGRTIEFQAGGGGRTLFHGVWFDERPTFVVAHAITSQKVVPRGTPLPLSASVRWVTGRLREPLGGRVMLTSRGSPMSVVPAAGLRV